MAQMWPLPLRPEVVEGNHAGIDTRNATAENTPALKLQRALNIPP